MGVVGNVAGGAASGAAMGSVVPGIGTVAGGVVGGVLGLFGGGDDEEGKPALDSDNAASGWGPNSIGYYGYGTPQDMNWGGDPNAANDFAQYGINMGKGLGGSQSAMTGLSSKFAAQSNVMRGPQAQENQQLSTAADFTRNWDQAGALQLAREAAMGQTPSAAAYQMQSGLDQSLANQQAIMGSARSNGGIALAGGNAAANSANLQNQTYNQMGQLRAQEMAQAQGLYGGLSGQMRDQDNARLQQASQMSQFNAGLNDQYKLGMANAATAAGSVGAQYANAGLGYYQAAQNPINQQLLGITNAHNIGQQTYDSAQNRVAGMINQEAGRAQQSTDSDKVLIGTGMQVGGQVLSGAVKGS